MVRTVPVGAYKLYADDSNVTGLKLLQNGLNYEQHIRRELERFIPQSVGFADIGANAGLHSISAKTIRPDVPVFAFEASTANVAHFARTIYENRIGNIAVAQVALSDRAQIIFASLDYSNTTHRTEDGTCTDDCPIPCASLPLDFFNLPPVDLVKMDVEGFEYRVLQGATKLMASRPHVIFEYCPEVLVRSNIEAVELLAWFTARHYTLTVLDYVPGVRRAFTDPALCHTYALSSCGTITDILATPCEKA